MMESFPAATREIRKPIFERLQSFKVFNGLEPKQGVTFAQVGRVLVDEVSRRMVRDTILHRELEIIEKDKEGVERDLAKVYGDEWPVLLSTDDVPKNREFREKHAKVLKFLRHLKEQAVIHENRTDRSLDYVMVSCAGVLRRLTRGNWQPPLARLMKAIEAEKRPGRPSKPGKVHEEVEDREIFSAERRVERVGGVHFADLQSILVLSRYPDLKRHRPDFTMFNRSDGWHFLLLAEHTRDRAIPSRYRKVNAETAEKHLLGYPHTNPKYVPPYSDLLDACTYKSKSGKEQPPPHYPFRPTP